ncbi:MAG: type III pantothenate kinase [Candidatus Eremiobacteraeota bacterium]|nr:type III pantothenate kinase [Candidatus Eremiobacteraeota bacterium]MBV8499135.1 type III pantothenate kinase [Candidatus Eremiobacteraeota bacterium]
MLLTIDVGNTETKLGCFSGAELKHTWRVTTELRRTPDEYGVFFTQLFATSGVDRGAIDAVAVASVVPKLDPVLESACRRFFDTMPLFLKPETQSLIPIVTENPSEVGADLVAAAIGARSGFGAPLIVVSYGTATAFIAISPAGEYLGVAIAPGVTVSIDALIGRTAKLPQIALEAPGSAIGRNTIEALQSGVVYGFAGQTEAIVARIRREMGGSARVVATGGLAEIVAKQTPIVDAIDPHLSLTGLRLFYGSEARGGDPFKR